LMMEEQKRRFSEAGVNRRPSAAHILTEDTDSFIIGQRVYVDGVKPGRIQFIGETKFGPGEWSGVFLDEPIGKNDGSVMNTRYFTCEPRHGVFSRLYRLTCLLFANNKTTDILIKMFPILITGYYVYITG